MCSANCECSNCPKKHPFQRSRISVLSRTCVHSADIIVNCILILSALQCMVPAHSRCNRCVRYDASSPSESGHNRYKLKEPIPVKLRKHANLRRHTGRNLEHLMHATMQVSRHKTNTASTTLGSVCVKGASAPCSSCLPDAVGQ